MAGAQDREPKDEAVWWSGGRWRLGWHLCRLNWQLDSGVLRLVKHTIGLEVDRLTHEEQKSRGQVSII